MGEDALEFNIRATWVKIKWLVVANKKMTTYFMQTLKKYFCWIEALQITFVENHCKNNFLINYNLSSLLGSKCCIVYTVYTKYCITFMLSLL